jgi:hypothetical protein
MICGLADKVAAFLAKPGIAPINADAGFPRRLESSFASFEGISVSKKLSISWSVIHQRGKKVSAQVQEPKINSHDVPLTG